MSCNHQYLPPEPNSFEECSLCGTYHSIGAIPPEAIYTDDYWSDKWKHGTLTEHNYNCDVHKENGITKNEFVLNKIWVQDRSAALEIGCAPGSLLGQLKSTCEFERVVGVEVDRRYEPEIRELAKQDVSLIFGFFPEVTKVIKEESFSLIVGLDIFEHAFDPDAFLAECQRLLKPDGQLLLMSPFRMLDQDLEERFFHVVEHVFIHSYMHVRDMLAFHGFTDLKFSRWTNGHDVVTARRI